MTEKVPRSIKHESIILGAQGLKQNDIAVKLEISVSTVKRIKRKMRKHGDVEGGQKKTGNPGKIDQHMEQVYFHYSAP
jgi:transposase